MRLLTRHGVVPAAVIQMAVLCSTAAWAQLARLGSEFQINSSPIIDPFGSRVAAGPGGGFVVVWDSQSGDGDGWGVSARRFDSDGEPIGGQFRVNSTTMGDQQQPRLALAADGSFLIVWTTDPASVVGQAFAPEGVARGPEVAVAEPEVNGPANSVAATDDGEFVVVWTDFFNGYVTRARRVNADGELLGASFSVSGVDFHLGQLFGAIATGSADSFLVVWYDEPLAEMHGRHFVSGDPTGPEFTVAAVNSGYVSGPEICGEDNGFVVTWATYDEAPFSMVQYRRYNQAGEAVTSPVRVTPKRQPVVYGRPATTCASNGDFVLVWQQDRAVAGRSFVGDDSADFGIGLGSRPSVAMLSGDDFVVTWDECRPEGGCDVFGQRFTLSGSTVCPGDCNLNGLVTVDELVLAVDALLTAQNDVTRRCLAADTNLDYAITVDELVAAVVRLLRGCP